MLIWFKSSNVTATRDEVRASYIDFEKHFMVNFNGIKNMVLC